MRTAKFVKTPVVFLIVLCLALPALSANIKKKCSFQGKRIGVGGSVSEFTMSADYIVREGPDSFIGKVMFPDPLPDDPNFKKIACIEGTAVKGTWTIYLIYDLTGIKEEWKGSGTFDKKTGKITIRGTGIETDSQSVCTFEMIGESK